MRARRTAQPLRLLRFQDSPALCGRSRGPWRGAAARLALGGYFIPLALRGLAAAAHLLLSDPPYPEALERYKATETRPACYGFRAGGLFYALTGNEHRYTPHSAPT